MKSSSPAKSFREWMSISFPIDPDLLKTIASEPIPNHLKRWWFAIGGTPLYLLMAQFITGIFLTFYYVPHPAEAFNSVALITTQVRFGWFIRSIHKWSAHLLIFTMMLHIIRVFFTGAFRKPRELNWMFGVVIMLVTLAFGFTGYSLIYEQVSYWASVVGTNVAEATPIIGTWMANFIRGGSEIGPNTLTRFFVFHVGVLPTAMIFLIGLHVVQIHIHGVTRLKFKGDESREKTFPFYPNHFYTELVAALSISFLLTILSLVYPAEMGEPANPMVTPEHIKPEWFFYAVFRWLKLTPFEVGIIGSILFLAILFLWPFIDRALEKIFPHREIGFWIGVFGFLAFLGLTIWEALA